MSQTSPTREAAYDPTKQVFSLFEEFKNFAFKGNVVDLAVGVIIGGAFSKIVDSLVKNIIMPLISVLLPGDQEYAKWAVTIDGKAVPFGLFIAEIVNFLILAIVLFLFIVKFLGWLMKTKKAEAVAPAPPPRQEVLLVEIRDLLKQQVERA
ncbi:large conductance mechanosensitive channel protein MscL [bacterium]|nr:large conductance mechanosensitive channel protein MscL [bacterium]